MNKENKIGLLNELQVIEKHYLLGVFSLVFVESLVICLSFNQLKNIQTNKTRKKKETETTNSEHSE